MNRIVNVTLTGGLIGLFVGSPQDRLNSFIKEGNSKGWRVVQIIPAESGNLFLVVIRLLILLVTLFLYTPSNGYYIVFEKENTVDTK